MKGMQLRARLRLVGGLLAGLVLFTLLLRSPVQALLATPGTQVFNWLRLQLSSIPQSEIWVIFILLATLLLHTSLPRPPSRQILEKEETAFSRERPVKKLAALIERSGSAYARRRLCQAVSELVVAALVEQNGRSPHQVKGDIIQRRLEMPEAVASYVSEGLRVGKQSPAGSRWRVGWGAQVDARLYQTLEFLEKEVWME